MVFKLFLIERVSIGSLEHLLPILLSLFFSGSLIFYSSKCLSKQRQNAVFHFFGCFISAVVIAFHLYHIGFGDYNVQTDLPLYLCSLIALLVPVFTYSRKFWMYEILLFWVIAGTLQGVITPDIAEGFPSFDYFRYWVVHLGLLTTVLYATFVFGMRPTLKSVFRSFFALQLYVLMVVAINWFLDANYFYLNEKPKSASLLDYFGEWPMYIIVVQLMLIPYFLMVYLPFYFSKRRTQKRIISQTIDRYP